MGGGILLGLYTYTGGVSFNILGDFGFGVGYPYLIEGNAGGQVELHFGNIGFGLGYGKLGLMLDLQSSAEDTDEARSINMTSTRYYRLSLIFGGDNREMGRGRSKVSIYGQLHGDDTWGFGVMFITDF
jgi:hypothetical protein